MASAPSVAVIDVWSRTVTPLIDTVHPVVAKATVTITRTAADHTASFAPDRRILFIRDPVAVWVSLSRYPYAHTFGSIEDKICRFDQEFANGNWDAILRYEDFVGRAPELVSRVDALGWACDESYYQMPRSFAEIKQFNMASSPWLEQHYENGWAFGNIKEGPITRDFATRPNHPDIEKQIAILSPALHRDYEKFWCALKPDHGLDG